MKKVNVKAVIVPAAQLKNDRNSVGNKENTCSILVNKLLLINVKETRYVIMLLKFLIHYFTL